MPNQHVLILGSGAAGVAAARALASREDVRVTLVARTGETPYIRMHIKGVAFGPTPPEMITLPLPDVEIISDTAVEVDTSAKEVLVDYVIGVEAGLDSNGRKNRSGTSMETIVESYLEPYCKSHGLSYLSQATPNAIKERWGFNVPVDKSSRRFDFAISNGKKLVLMEVNFYGGGGSKLKATCGEYKGLNELLDVPNVDFVWVTDGEGWNTTKDPLRSAFDALDYLWNLDWLYRNYLEDLFK